MASLPVALLYEMLMFFQHELVVRKQCTEILNTGKEVKFDNNG
ncbi:MAG: hypothetical protein ACKOEV_11250 [Cytophagales bacterium]